MIRNIAVVSLSSGIIGEPSAQFEVEIGLRRLEAYGLNVKFMPHARRGLEFVKAHPEKQPLPGCVILSSHESSPHRF